METQIIPTKIYHMHLSNASEWKRPRKIFQDIEESICSYTAGRSGTTFKDCMAISPKMNYVLAPHFSNFTSLHVHKRNECLYLLKDSYEYNHVCTEYIRSIFIHIATNWKLSSAQQ